MQVHKILRGLPTIRSIVAIGSGAAKLVSLPVESYKKDRRVLKGMQRGKWIEAQAGFFAGWELPVNLGFLIMQAQAFGAFFEF